MGRLNEEQKMKLLKMRGALDDFVAQVADIPQKINQHIEAIRIWKPAVYSIGDVRCEDGIPYKCVQAHDSTMNDGWKPSATPALWMQYHGTTIETAREWVQPTGAHDMYLAGEYMIWNGNVYICKENTIYSPDAYSAAWSMIN